MEALTLVRNRIVPARVTSPRKKSPNFQNMDNVKETRTSFLGEDYEGGNTHYV
jgi:hypothetical protein